MTDSYTQWIGFDLETKAHLPEHALQAYRYPEAWISAASIASTSKAVGLHNPTTEQLTAMLTPFAGKHLVAWNTCFDVSWLYAVGIPTDLIESIKWLDGMLLWMHVAREPESETTKKKSYSLAAAMHEFYPDQAGFKDFTDFQADDPEALAGLLHRNKEDARFTAILAERFWTQLGPGQRRAALIEASCIPAVAQTYNRGITLDAEALALLRTKLVREGAEAYAALKEHHPDIDSVNLGSPKQVGTLLYDVWGLTPPKITPTGNLSTDKFALFDLAETYPQARLLRDYRESQYNLAKYVTAFENSLAYNGDGVSRPQAKIFGTYCVPGDMEVLTPEGWQRLDQWTGGRIAQVYPQSGKIEFLTASQFKGPVVSEWIHVKHSRLDGLFTLGHTIPYLSQKTREWKTAQAHLHLTRRLDIPIAGNISRLSGQITADQMRVLVMFQADGYVCPTRRRYRFTFKKHRKILRAKQLLDAVGVVYREYVCAAYPDRTELCIGVKSIPAWWRPEYKVFGDWVLDTTSTGLEAFMTEVVHWDGSHHPDGGVTYTSSKAENLEWVTTVAHLTGRKASIHKCRTKCHVSDERPTAQVKADQCSLEIHNLRSYCAETKTGFWLARSKGTIFVTGNTGRMTYYSKQGRGKAEKPTGFALHQTKRGADFRNVIVPPPGYDLIEVDFAGQEFRIMAVASGDERMLELCQPGEDAHSYMGSQVAGVEYRDLIARVKAENVEAAIQRKLGKFCNLSYQFRISHKTATIKAKVEYGLNLEEMFVKASLNMYKRSYPGVPHYWQEAIFKSSKCGYAETFAGRRINLNGDWRNKKTSWALESTAINYPVQGSGGEMKYLALAVAKSILLKYSSFLYFELHDGIYVISPRAKTKACFMELRRVLSNLPYKQIWGREFPIKFPVDGKVGNSWGQLREPAW